MNTYIYTKEDLEDNYDEIKVIVANAIAYHFHLNGDEIDQWCKNNTIILKKKNIFRTISDFWKKEKESQSGLYAKIVTDQFTKKEK